MNKVRKAQSSRSLRRARGTHSVARSDPAGPGRKANGAAAELFPMFLKIAGKPCLVVGAGPIAKSKIESLVRCGADVRVVAPHATETVRDAARAGAIRWEQRRFRNSDLRGQWLVVAATSSPELHEQIFRQARRAGILCNAVDEPERCDFYYPAVVRRGPLQIAVSTSGCAPSLAQRLRRELDGYFAPEYGAWTAEVGRARSALMATGVSAEKRKRAMLQLSSAKAFDAFRKSAKARGQGRNKA
jgi:precorrin-2 dehydrogenase/sirohydrochlorin ferrochelatase